MAIINFPPTAGEPTDGSFTYTFNDVVYSWTGTYWAANSQSSFDNRYVEVAGDVMTGSLDIDNSTAVLGVPVGTTAERPSMTAGDLRWNSATGYAEIGTAAGAFKQLAYVGTSATVPADLTLSGTVEMASAYYVNNLTISANSIVTPAAGISYITATGNVTIESGCAFNFQDKGVEGGSGGARISGTIDAKAGTGLAPGTTKHEDWIIQPAVPVTSFMSSSGASGKKASTTSSGESQAGGSAGGSLIIFCLGSISVGANCTFNVNGQDGNPLGAPSGNNHGGGGGGAGGFIVMQASSDLTIDASVTMTANGGDGANAGFGGGGGGGGYIVLGSIGTYSATMTVPPTLTSGATGVGSSSSGTRGGGGGSGGGAGGSTTGALPSVVPAQDGQLLTNFIIGNI